MLTIPVSAYQRFLKEEWPKKKGTGLRFGQAFHQYMKLEKSYSSNEDQAFCDKLYQADGDDALQMIYSRMDYLN